jgi:ATP synthase protein I
MKPDKKVLKAVVMITQIGITMLVPIFLCVFVGIRLDEWLGTKLIAVFGILLGIVVAFRNVYIMTKQFYAKDKAKEDAELKYINELKQKHQEDNKRK